MTPPLEADAGLVERLIRKADQFDLTDVNTRQMMQEAACRIESLTAELEQERSIALSHLSSRKLWEAAAKENMERALVAEAEIDRLKALSDLSVRRMAEMAEPGFIGAFAARDIALERALAAEARLATREAETRADERERCAKIADQFGLRDNAKARAARLIATAIRNRCA